ncbi:MAG: hypothetical protein RLZZ292_1708 [Bacteroidota bacterium]|jgi:hypothetical protein
MKNTFFICLLSLLAIQACRVSDSLTNIDDATFASHDAEYAIPLLQAKTSLQSILETKASSVLKIDADGSMKLVYSGDVIQRTAVDLFPKLTQIPFVATDTFQKIGFQNIPGGLDVYKIEFKQGEMNYNILSSIKENVKVMLHIPDLTKNNVEFRDTVDAFYIPGLTQGATFLGRIIDITGYKLNLQADTIIVKYDARNAKGERLKLNLLGGTLDNLQFSYLEGYMQNQVFNVDRQQIDIGLFDEFVNGSIYFEEPKFTINVRNSFGFPLATKANLVNVISVKHDTLPLESQYIKDGIFFEYPKLNEVGQTKKTTFQFNKDNSNIAEILGKGPRIIDYDIDCIGNPNGDVKLGFATDSTKFVIGVDVELPIYGKAAGFASKKAYAVDFSKLTNAKKAEFKIVTDNQMPLQLGTQIYFRDDKQVVLDSLFEASQAPANILEGATTDQQGNVTKPSHKETIVAIAPEKLNRIRSAKDALIKTYFSTTPNAGSVRILSTQEVNIRIGVKVIQ